MEQEPCPICMEKLAEYYTECNHSFCINCLCKIKKCAMCRKDLLREQLCKEIRGVNEIESLEEWNGFLTRRQIELVERSFIPDTDPEPEIWNLRPSPILLHLNNEHAYGTRINNIYAHRQMDWLNLS